MKDIKICITAHNNLEMALETNATLNSLSIESSLLINSNNNKYHNALNLNDKMLLLDQLIFETSDSDLKNAYSFLLNPFIPEELSITNIGSNRNFHLFSNKGKKIIQIDDDINFDIYDFSQIKFDVASNKLPFRYKHVGKYNSLNVLLDQQNKVAILDFLKVMNDELNKSSLLCSNVYGDSGGNANLSFLNLDEDELKIFCSHFQDVNDFIYQQVEIRQFNLNYKNIMSVFMGGVSGYNLQQTMIPFSPLGRNEDTLLGVSAYYFFNQKINHLTYSNYHLYKDDSKKIKIEVRINDLIILLLQFFYQRKITNFKKMFYELDKLSHTEFYALSSDLIKNHYSNLKNIWQKKKSYNIANQSLNELIDELLAHITKSELACPVELIAIDDKESQKKFLANYVKNYIKSIGYFQK